MTMKDHLDELLENARENLKAMTPSERAAMWVAQRESWARGMAPCEHGVADWEDCADCLIPKPKDTSA